MKLPIKKILIDRRTNTFTLDSPNKKGGKRECPGIFCLEDGDF